MISQYIPVLGQQLSLQCHRNFGTLCLFSASKCFRKKNFCWVFVVIGKFTSGFTAHGPALMLKYEHPDAKIQFPISIDITPAINTHLSFEQLGLRWPREATWTPWPSVELQLAVKAKGIMMVAKQNFFWLTSFVECEKELSKHADADGGNRKQVHRLMKMFNDRFWRKQTNSLNTYMLKVSSFLAVTCKLVSLDLIECDFKTNNNIHQSRLAMRNKTVIGEGLNSVSAFSLFIVIIIYRFFCSIN